MRATALLSISVLLGLMILPVPAQKMKSSSSDASGYQNRLPNYYGQIGLNDKQRQEIYDIQAEYHVEIEQLEQELEELKAEESLQIQSVLSEPQKELLNRKIAEARARRKARSN